MLKTPAEYERDKTAKLKDIFLELLTSLVGVSAGSWQKFLVAESGMFRTQIGTHNTSENGRSVWDALYDTTP
jgi:hypothetical protein